LPRFFLLATAVDGQLRFVEDIRPHTGCYIRAAEHTGSHHYDDYDKYDNRGSNGGGCSRGRDGYQ
jgi:hypothetical protein